MDGKWFRESAFANAAQIAGFPVLIGLALFSFGGGFWGNDHYALANLFFAFGALFTVAGILVFLSVFVSRIRVPKVPKVDINRSALARVVATFQEQPFSESVNGYIYHAALLELTNLEASVMLVRLSLNVEIDGVETSLEASAPCRQESARSRMEDLTLGALPHLSPDIRLDPTVPVRGHTEFVVHPIRLNSGNQSTFGQARLKITEVISGRSKVIDW